MNTYYIDQEVVLVDDDGGIAAQGVVKAILDDCCYLVRVDGLDEQWYAEDMEPVED